jgi:hypothetical protein
MSRNVFFLFFSPRSTQCLVSRRVQKYNFFSISQVFFESFLKTFVSAFLSYSPFNQRHHLLNLSKNLLPSSKITTFHFANLFLPLKDILSLSIKISKNVCCYCGCKITLYTLIHPFFKHFFMLFITNP